MAAVRGGARRVPLRAQLVCLAKDGEPEVLGRASSYHVLGDGSIWRASASTDVNSPDDAASCTAVVAEGAVSGGRTYCNVRRGTSPPDVRRAAGPVDRGHRRPPPLGNSAASSTRKAASAALEERGGGGRRGKRARAGLVGVPRRAAALRIRAGRKPAPPKRGGERGAVSGLTRRRRAGPPSLC